MEGDEPALSLFNAVNQNSLENAEEEENIEDIRQRQQEIQNFLTAALDEFNYDESSCDETQKSSIHMYTENNDQLAVLYEMRCKEVKELLEERDCLKAQLEEERSIGENRRVMSENLLEQCQVSMKQLQEALVAKTEKIGDYEKVVNDLQSECQEKVKEIYKLHNEMEILRDDRDNLNKKLNEKELESISTNKVTEREMQNQYLTQISLLQEKLKDCEREIKKLETCNCELKTKVQQTLRDKNDLIQEKDKTISDLKQNFDELQTQNAFLLEEFQRTKYDFQKYVDETKAAKQAYEKIKEQIAPSRLQEIDSTVSNLKKLLQEKDEEISELSKVLHLTQSKSTRDAAVMTERQNKPSINLQILKRDFQNTKNEVSTILRQYETDFVETASTVAVLMNNLRNVANMKDKFLFELRRTAINEIESLRNDKSLLYSTLTRVNHSLKEAGIQANLIENRIKSPEFIAKPIICDKETNTENDEIFFQKQFELNEKTYCDKETNTTERDDLLQKELELRDRIAQDFQQKLINIEEKYKNASQSKLNSNTLKQQLIELTTKLHKYKSLYEESRKGMTDFLTITNNHIKNLESKVLAVESGRQQTQKEMEILKLLVEDRESKIKEMYFLINQQKNEIKSFKKQVLMEKFKDMASLNEKFDGIARNASLLVSEVENEFDKRIKTLTNKDL